MDRVKRRAGVISYLDTAHKDKMGSAEDTAALLQSVFGSIAIVGTSSKAVYPESIDILSFDDKKTTKTFPLNSFVRALKALSRAASEPPMKGSTLRQLCEPFAEEAKLYLMAMAPKGIYTQLAMKMSKLGNKEPHVCFDFSGALDLIKLSAQEAGVIQALHSRLFRTEGAKGVFAAQSSVGEQAVEI
ncbi:coat protein [Blueberry green mosaic associated virus]|uniref:Coat protein n=1 Tax=Blueberry green mosaic associated virus TaxID=2605718 RepID=A0AAF1DAW5_9VIRU|nr:coat protein [Blueberry green mosaic associated virus]QEH60476.1 coat protein [Blueberry green mosaic associated virus]